MRRADELASEHAGLLVGGRAPQELKPAVLTV